jgi:lipoprotein-releasing system permease protein
VYQALLTRRYLTTKVMPLLAALAVMLCAAMVLIVWSIMGGFLVMFLDAGRTLMGDVSIQWPTVGFAHYEELVADLEKRPEVAAAAPCIETFGMISLPDERLKGVKIMGIEGESFAKVTGFESTLWWRPLAEPLPRDKERRDPRLGPPEVWAKRFEEGKRLSKPDPVTGEPRPAAVLGIEVTGFNKRQPGGWFTPMEYGTRAADGSIRYSDQFILKGNVTLSVVPLSKRGMNVDVVNRVMPVANEFKSGLFDIDENLVCIPMDELQRMLKMDAAQRLGARHDDSEGTGVEVDPATGEEKFEDLRTAGVEPARVTTVYVRAAPGVTPEALSRVCGEVYAKFADRFGKDVPPAPVIKIKTWRQLQGSMIAAVEKETVLVLFINTFISMVASLLILAIFWAMVSEKTKDIGVLRSMGAGKRGVAGIWLFYGIMIGVIGSGLGLAIATGIVWNINPIHEWMGRALGISIWDPSVYYFTEIPHEVNPARAALVFGGGLFFSVLGALVPAVRAANMDPVRALRFE